MCIRDSAHRSLIAASDEPASTLTALTMNLSFDHAEMSAGSGSDVERISSTSMCSPGCRTPVVGLTRYRSLLVVIILKAKSPSADLALSLLSLIVRFEGILLRSKTNELGEQVSAARDGPPMLSEAMAPVAPFWRSDTLLGGKNPATGLVPRCAVPWPVTWPPRGS